MPKQNMNRQKAIKKIIRKLHWVIGLYQGPEWPTLKSLKEREKLEDMIRQAIETDWEP